MSVNVNDILSTTVDYLTETVVAEKLKFVESGDSRDLTMILDMVSDLGFQTDFALMKSPTEIQELYDIYRNKPADESNVEVRLLLNVASHIHNVLMDKAPVPEARAWDEYIVRLANLLTLHSNVKPEYSFQDESLISGMDFKQWDGLLKNNPWLVAAVSIQYIPNYYLTSILLGVDTLIKDTGE